MIRVDTTSLLHSALFDGYVERVDDERRALDCVNGRAHDASAARVEHAIAVDLATLRPVLRDVGDSQLTQ